MFERFTDEARSVVVRAQQVARHRGATSLEPVHLLVSVSVGAGRGRAVLAAAGVSPAALAASAGRAADPLDAGALAALGVDLERVRESAEAAFGAGALDRGHRTRRGHLPVAGGTRRALEQSLRIAVRNGPRRGTRIDDGHLLAGVLTVEDPVVTRTLRDLGVAVEDLLDRAAGTRVA